MISLTAIQARLNARTDMVIFNEVVDIMRDIIATTETGGYGTVVKSTTMTNETVDIVVTGSVSDPTVSIGETLIINGTTITLGTTGVNLNSIIADINDSGYPGLVADKDESNRLVLTYTAPAATEWSVEFGAGTANLNLGFTAETVTSVDNVALDYYSVYQGIIENRAMSDAISTVRTHLESMGYSVDIRLNTATNRTFMWVINW